MDKKIGLALGSGSSRGWAHIGVLKCLEDHGIPVHCIAAASIGAYVGVIYAAGDLERLESFALGLDRRKVLSQMDITFPKSGLLDGKRIPDLIRACTDVQYFSELKIPVNIVATDILTGDSYIFREGDLFTAIRASVSVPGVLTPVKHGQHLLIDGGVSDPVPSGLCRRMGADICIAVDLNAGIKARKFQGRHSAAEGVKKESFRVNTEFLERFGLDLDLNDTALVKRINHWLNPAEDNMPNIMEVLGASIDIMESRIAEVNLRLDPPDILLQPDLKNLRMFDFDKAGKTIQVGYAVMERALPELERLLG